MFLAGRKGWLLRGCQVDLVPIDRTPANRYPDALETNPVDISPEELQFIIDHGSSLLSEGFYDMLVEKCATTLLPLI